MYGREHLSLRARFHQVVHLTFPLLVNLEARSKVSRRHVTWAIPEDISRRVSRGARMVLALPSKSVASVNAS